MPLVSVLMPTRNQARTLPAALDSVLAQTVRDLEVIVVDDASTDETPDVLAGYRVWDDRIRVVRNPTPAGVARSLNRGLAEVRGSIVARMDSDDRSLPDRLARQVAFLDAHPEVGLVGTYIRFMDVDGRELPYPPWRPPTEHDDLAWELLFDNPFCHASVSVRADILRAAGGYDPAFPNEDLELWTRLVFATRLANLAEPLVVYRVPAERYAEKRAGWAPQIQTVACRYAARLLGREVPPALVRALFDVRHGRRPADADPDTLIEASVLLAELFDAMRRAGILTAPERIEPRLRAQIGALTAAALVARHS